MFKFLKEKLTKGIKNISKKIEEEGTTEETVQEIKAEPKKEEKKGFFSKLKEKFSRKEDEIKEEETIEQDIKIKDEVEEYKKKEELKEEKKELEKEEKKVKEKIEKKEIPKIHELTQRKVIKDEVKKKEEEVGEATEEPRKTFAGQKVAEKEEPEEEIMDIPASESKELEEKKGFFQRIKQSIITKKINHEQFEKIFWDLELALLENNVAVEVIEKIKDDLIQEIVDTPLPRGKIEDTITNTLKTSIEQLLSIDSFSLLEKIKQKKPFVICFVGINGSGKTTTIAKIAKLLLNKKFTVVLAAADTFRAAAIDQLQLHANKLGVKLIKHNYGSGPAAVAFDAVKHAQAKGVDVVLIDTAGRMHSNENLIDEMKKIVRVAKPDLKIFVGESITGNDCVEQAKQFNEAIGIDAIILAKADVDEKGGAAISVSYVTQKPIVYIGTGQDYEDLKEFDPNMVINSLGLA